MENIHRIIIIKDGEYSLGYRIKMVSNSAKLERKEKCLKKIVDYNSISKYKKTTINGVIKDWKTNLYIPNNEEAVNKSMAELKNVKNREQLRQIYLDYINNIFKESSGIYKESVEKLTKYAVKLKSLVEEYPDIIYSFFIKYIVRNYYKHLLNRKNTNDIDELEIYKISHYNEEKTLDNIMDSIEERPRDFDSKDLYTFSKMVVNDELDRAYSRKFVNLCGDYCKMRYFDRCAKIYPTYYGASPNETLEEAHDLTRYPFITDGYQTEKFAYGKWSIDEVCVSGCDFKNNTKMQKSRRLELINENEKVE